MANRVVQITIVSYFAVAVIGLIPVRAEALVNGRTLEGYPDLVRLVFKDGTMCTGAYINDTTILTAAHCLIKKNGEAFHALEKTLSVNDRVLPVKHLENIQHPKFDHGWWPAFDVGLIKTSKNDSFQGGFKISRGPLSRSASVTLLGCGISSFDPRKRDRTVGENRFLRMGNVLLFLGPSESGDSEVGRKTSVAPNDSGGPILDAASGEIIAISTQTTLVTSMKYRAPAVSVGTAVVGPEISDFIQASLGE
jgi:hypothetical protein